MEVRVGEVIHYYNRINVAVLCLDSPLNVGDYVHFLGYTTDFNQPIFSMEVKHRKIAFSASCHEVAVQVVDTVRKGDTVYRVVEESPETEQPV